MSLALCVRKKAKGMAFFIRLANPCVDISFSLRRHQQCILHWDMIKRSACNMASSLFSLFTVTDSSETKIEGSSCSTRVIVFLLPIFWFLWRWTSFEQVIQNCKMFIFWSIRCIFLLDLILLSPSSMGDKLENNWERENKSKNTKQSAEQG